MSYRKYYYKRKKFNRSSTSKVYDLGVSFNVVEYLQNEFFELDEDSLSKSFVLYKDLYGESAYRYLLGVYYSWKSGAVVPSAQSLRRIIECVPPFLSYEKRFFILEKEIQSFARKIFVARSIVKSQDLEIFYQDSISKIDAFGLGNLSWFIGKGIIDEYSALSIIAACKCVLVSRLNQEVEILCLTLPAITKELHLMFVDVLNSNYSVQWLNLNVNLGEVFDFANIKYKIQKIPKKASNDLLTLYMLDNLVKILKYEKVEFNEFTAAQSQLNLCRVMINTIKRYQIEADISQVINTAIGTIQIKCKIESIPKMLADVWSKVANLFAFITGPVLCLLFIVEMVNAGLISESTISISCFVLLPFLIVGISKFPSTITAIKYYGQQRKRPFAS